MSNNPLADAAIAYARQVTGSLEYDLRLAERIQSYLEMMARPGKVIQIDEGAHSAPSSAQRPEDIKVLPIDPKALTAGYKLDTEKQARFDLIPPVPLYLLAEQFGVGSKKYSDRGWEAGMKWGRVFAAICRHLWKWWWGEDIDPENGRHHLAAVACNAFILLHYATDEQYAEWDDRPGGTGKPFPLV